MICIKTFKEKTSSDFNTWRKWINFTKRNYRYSLEHSTVNDFEGKCNAKDLPSYHPYWKNEIRKQKIEILETLKHNYKNCKINPDKIKYIFNSTTSIEDLAERIKKLEISLCQ